MSAETIRGVDVRDWEGSTFDPTNKRFFSILPDCDADEAYCVRHEHEIPAARIALKYDGAIYTTAEDWEIYTCPDCYREVGPTAEALFESYLSWAFETFDDTDVDVLDDAFRYVGDADDLDAEPEVSVRE